YGESPRVRIQPDGIEGPALLIWFAAVEGRAFEFPAWAEETGREHTKADVGGVLPVVGQRCGGNVHRRRAMHEGDGTEGRLPRRRGVRRHADAARERSFIHHGQLHPEIMGVLAVVQWLAAIAFAALEQQRIAPAGYGRGVQA